MSKRLTIHVRFSLTRCGVHGYKLHVGRGGGGGGLSYRCNRVSGLECSEKRRYIIPKTFLALEQMVSVCLDHVGLEVSSTPKYS